MPLYQLTLSVEGKVLRRETPLIWIGAAWGGFPRVGEATDGNGGPGLEIVILRSRSRFGMARLLFRVVRYLLRGERQLQFAGITFRRRTGRASEPQA